MSVGIIGYGRFGKLLHTILKDDFDIVIVDKDDSLQPLQSCKSIFLCVPIHALNDILHAIASLETDATIIDTCSVKSYPVDCMQQLLPQHAAIATHPLFGPDSYFEDTENRMMMYPVQHAAKPYTFWKHYFQQKAIHIIEMTPDEHDRYAARSQGITHLVGRILQHMDIKSTPIDTLGFKKLLDIINQTCNDSWDLFYDLQKFNPYTQSLIDEIKASLNLLIEDARHSVHDSK